MDHHGLIRLDTVSLQAFTRGCFVIQLADVQHATIRQVVTRTNCQHAAARVCPHDYGVLSLSESRNKNLGSAGGALAGEHDDWTLKRERFGSEEGCRDSKTCANAISKFAQTYSRTKKERSHLSHRFRIAAAVVPKIDNDAARSLQLFFNDAREGNRHGLGERMNFNNNVPAAVSIDT